MNADRFRGGGEALYPLVASSRAEGWGFVAKLAAELEQGDVSKPRTALFRFYDGTPAGVCRLVPDPHAGRLRHLYVLPPYRCGGGATALVQSVIGEARRHYRVLRRTQNPDAARFYETVGFIFVAEPTATRAPELP